MRMTLLLSAALLLPAAGALAWPTPENKAAGKNSLNINVAQMPNNWPAEMSDNHQKVATASVVKAGRRQGESCLQVERLVRDGNARFNLQTVSVVPGGRYWFSCYVKSTQGNPAIMFDFPGGGRMEDPVTLSPETGSMYGGHMIAWQRQLSDRPDEWRRIDQIFTVPPGATSLTVGMGYSWTLGTAWYDDFSLYLLDDDTKR